MKTQIPKWARKAIVATMIFFGIIIVLGIIHPRVFYIVANILWTIGFTLSILFVIVGILTILGRKKEAGAVIDLALEGSLTAIRIIEFLKELKETFIEISKRVILIAIPYFSYIIAAITYLIVIILYKAYGTNNDVLVMTIAVTIVLTFLAGLMNLPKKDDNKMFKSAFLNKVTKSFTRHFIDGFEVALLVLFLTIDSTDLFFLPDALNVPISAQFGNYDFMQRGFSTYQIDVTLKLVMIGLLLEFIRNVLRLVAEAKYYYRFPQKYFGDTKFETKTELLKATIKKTISESKDEIMRFTAFTSLMIFAFLFFPRLKLVALIFASLTNLLLDIIFSKRLTYRKQEDLLSRLFNKIFRIKSNVVYNTPIEKN